MTGNLFIKSDEQLIHMRKPSYGLKEVGFITGKYG
jgi:hypothetical protein